MDREWLAGVHLSCSDQWYVAMDYGIEGDPIKYLKSLGIVAECYSASGMTGFRFKVLDPKTLPEKAPEGFHTRVNGELVSPYSRDEIMRKLGQQKG